jgi:hypothetical protein
MNIVMWALAGALLGCAALIFAAAGNLIHNQWGM